MKVSPANRSCSERRSVVLVGSAAAKLADDAWRTIVRMNSVGTNNTEGFRIIFLLRRGFLVLTENILVAFVSSYGDAIVEQQSAHFVRNRRPTCLVGASDMH